MTFGSLFAGIGGMDLGLERAGMTCSWQVEIDPFARRILAKHWPAVRRHDDVRTFPPGDPDDWGVDLICGGFPCQDISFAGPGGGLDGARSGLWYEYARVIRVLRPRLVVVENVPALLVRGLDRVLGSLAEMGYDAEWGCIPAAAVGAPHIRERVFILAHSHEIRCDRTLQGIPQFAARRTGTSLHTRWTTEPDMGRVVDGVPSRMDVSRLSVLGNAVVPQVAEYVGRLILSGQEVS